MGMLSGKQERYFGIGSPADLIPRRTIGNTWPVVGDAQAMHYSAVWACLRLRADIVSTSPVDVYRDVVLEPGGPKIQVDVPKPKILVNPGGEFVGWHEWSYSSQIELDKSGNAIGIIREVDGMGKPSRIDLKASNSVSILMKGNDLSGYRIDGVRYDPNEIWHEKQYTVAGMHVGLSPIAYAAYTLSEQMSVQQFVTNWFMSGATPRARLRNSERKVGTKEALIVKEAWRASQAMGEPFVHGSDWEYNLIQAEKASADWLQSKRYGAIDIARFFGCPADLIDAAVSGQSITYANIGERNLQFLIMNLGPAVERREVAFSNGLLSKPRYVKLDTDSALLRMDPHARIKANAMLIQSRQLAPSEARASENLPPFTDEQKAEFKEFWPMKEPTAPISAQQFN